MSVTGKITGNVATGWMVVAKHPVHIALDGSFGSGSVAIEQDISGSVSTVRDNGTAIGITSDDNSSYNFQTGDKIRLNMSGASSPDVNFKVTGV